MSICSFERLAAEKQGSVIAAGIKEFAGKSYTDASTDAIAAGCGISKGLLFHYFGSKRELYLYCLSKSLELLMTKTEEITDGGFYATLFSAMDGKLRLCMEHPDETHFVNMASREGAAEVSIGKNEILRSYTQSAHQQSAKTMMRAMSALSLKEPAGRRVSEGLFIYFNAIMNKYLLLYQEMPDEFFKNADAIKAEMEEYLDLMLFGICREAEQ